MEKKFNYVYLTTNLINGKQYVGDHSTNNLNDGYIGSGILFSKKVKQYGKENFKKEIIKFFDTREEAFNAQEKYIIKYNTHVTKNGYNVNKKGGYHLTSNEMTVKISNAKKGKKQTEIHIINKIKAQVGKKRSKAARKNISESLKNRKLSEEHKQKLRKPKTEEHKKHLSDSHKGKIPWNKGLTKETDERVKNIGIKSGKSHVGKITKRKGKKYKEIYVKKYGEIEGIKKYLEFTLKQRESHIGKKQSEETKEKRAKKLRGKIRSEETKQRMKHSHKKPEKIKCMHCNKKYSFAMYTRWHGEKCKYKRFQK